YPAASVSEGGGGAAPRRVRLTQTGRDELLSIRRGDWVEVTSDTRDLLHQPGTLTRVDDLDQAGTVLILTDDVSVHFLEQGLKVRRWDQAGPALPLTPGPVLLEDGIRITFSAGSYNTGDYWTFAARAAVRDNSTGEVEAINNALPQGILHSYAPLGLVTWSTPANLPVAAQITDCRPLFPPLTDLRASDVSYDNSKCQLPGVKTVQQAIDQLCQQHEGACTFVIKPGQDLQAIVDQIPAGGDASICFQAGSYVLSQSVIFKGKGHLKLTGASKATQLIINKAEAALVFEGCESVLVRDLSAESRAQGAIIPHLNGVLTFISCGEVSVEAVELRTSHDTDTAASGLAVRPSSENTPGARQVRVLHSRFFVGNDQLGILLVNVERSQVEDNLMEVVEFPGAVRLQDLVRGRRSRARLSSLLMSNAKTSAGEPAAGGVQNVAVRIGDNMVNFTTAAALRKVWQPLITLFPAQNIADARSAQLYVQKLAGRILTDERVRNAIPALREFINALLRDAAASAAAGVTVAGKLAAETRILNNTILGFRQGVHIGLSHRELQRGAPDLAGLVTIAGNRVVCRLTFDSLLEQRHGIFVGNAASTLIENNRIHLDRRAGAERYEVQGILLHGVFGPRLLVRQNHLGFFRVGILVVPIGSPSVPLQNRLWVVAENLAERAAAVVQAPATVKQVDNVMT
ncbi:MAG: hypothetical protein HY835_14175, partial [Anaerolineae bacterium]|nr:hypothetical protein [Anaerolineae bacterium]